MPNKFDSEKYIYCEECDIFYNKKLEDIAKIKREEIMKSEYPAMSIFIVGCPLCKGKSQPRPIRISPKEGEQCRRLTRGPRTRLTQGKTLITTKNKKLKK